ncbi:multicopper oxidase family protein [Sphaerimonospora sp. CA-214678]|uniref:multicopper oxidase family protein n=1 Tax=Sphaerimonospora sp. CA-214678 TaxID=3240029 RepID=UPI003D91C1F3
MAQTKLLVSAVAFAVSLAVPLWTVSVGQSVPAAGGDTPAATSSSAEMDMSSHDMPEADDGTIDWKTMDQMMAKRDKSFPAPTKGEGAQPLEPKVLADGTKEFELTTKVVEWEVEPGKTVEAWTYNGAVPGPTLHVDVGDKVRIVLRNELPESTVIHWHGLIIPNAMDGVANVTQDPVPPGESFTYAFTAQEQMVGWYHSHHDGTKQVTNGLFGTILIGEVPLPDEAKGAKISQEIPMLIQDAGTIGMTINGKSFPATKPVRTKVGDWIEVHYINAGTMAHPMHLHGMPMLVIAKDGYPLPEPYKADTVNVAPGERYTVLIHTIDPGKWAWHCHIFPHSEGAQGMFGIFTELLVA